METPIVMNVSKITEFLVGKDFVITSKVVKSTTEKTSNWSEKTEHTEQTINFTIQKKT